MADRTPYLRGSCIRLSPRISRRALSDRSHIRHICRDHKPLHIVWRLDDEADTCCNGNHDHSSHRIRSLHNNRNKCHTSKDVQLNCGKFHKVLFHRICEGSVGSIHSDLPSVLLNLGQTPSHMSALGPQRLCSRSQVFLVVQGRLHQGLLDQRLLFVPLLAADWTLVIVRLVLVVRRTVFELLTAVRPLTFVWPLVSFPLCDLAALPGETDVCRRQSPQERNQKAR